MRNNSHLSPSHAFWHRRVEGQIKHCMNAHPEWFTGDRGTIINSLAKRIVGEIVACFDDAPHAAKGDCSLPFAEGDGVAPTALSRDKAA